MSNVRVQGLVLGAGLLLMALKFVAWRITGSSTILSDALESIVNVVAGAFAWYSLWLAGRPRDREHPYGHGKVEFISAGIEGGLVIVAGLFIIWRAGMAWWQGVSLHQMGLGIALTASAGAVNLAMGLLLRQRGRKARSVAMEASGIHLLSDAWSTGAMLLGLLVIQLTGLNWLDPLFAILFALYIMASGVRIFRRSVAGIMDEADHELAAQVIADMEAHRRPAWVDVHNFRIIKYGAVLHIDCHITLPWYYTLEQAHAEQAMLEDVVRQGHEHGVELFVHMDPCIPSSCAICILEGCPQRTTPLKARLQWTLDLALRNAKHVA